MAGSKKAKPIELWVKEDAIHRRIYYNRYRQRYVYEPEFDREFFIVGFGDREIEVTVAKTDATAAEWIETVVHNHYKRSSGDGGPLIVGIYSYAGSKSNFKPKEPIPISILSICVSGARCLQIPTRTSWGADDAVPFAVKKFLTDPRVKLVGIGVEKLAARMERECRLRVDRTAELRPMVEAAFGKRMVIEAVPRKGTVGMEELAYVAMGGIHVSKKPDKTVSRPWGEWADDEDEEVMYAAADAFMAFEIATNSLAAIRGRRRR